MLIAVLALMVLAPERVSIAIASDPDPKVLAEYLLSSDVSARLVGHQVEPIRAVRYGYEATFWEAPKVLRARTYLCSRRTYRYTIHPDVPRSQVTPDIDLWVGPTGAGPDYAVTFPEPATAEACEKAEGWVRAYSPLEEPIADVLEGLAVAMSAARASGPLPFELTCASNDPAKCADPRQVLANLQLDDIELVHLTGEEGNSVAIPGSRARQIVPPAEGQWPDAYVMFRSDQRVGRPWMVTLTGEDGVEAVELKKFTQINL